MNRTRLIAPCVLLLTVIPALVWFVYPNSISIPGLGLNIVVIDRTDYHEPPATPQPTFVDDVFDRTAVPPFDPERIDSRPADGWTVNLSGAVTRLDVEMLKPDVDAHLLKLHPTYAEALRAIPGWGPKVLPSVNLIDGKAKQFDDGLYAALELHWFRGRAGEFAGDLDFLQRLAAAIPPDSLAAAYLAEGLQLAKITISAADRNARSEFQAEFASRELNTKPIGFYAWNKKLKQCYRVGRYFQVGYRSGHTVWQPIMQALRSNPDLRNEYRRILARWARLSNSPSQMTVDQVIDQSDQTNPSQSATLVSLFPPGTNRESELTRRLFPNGFSSRVDLMLELVNAIREGTVELHPTEKSGWYDYQVYALETLLVPKRGEESNRLLLSANYKKRAMEAFQALITKRKETHVLRSASGVKSAARPPLKNFSPRLRLEPAPTYYLRMARSYQFLEAALHEFVDEPHLVALVGLTEKGNRSQSLLEELQKIRHLFYGCYALSAEDIGLGLNLTSDEESELTSSRAVAESWLNDYANDPDLNIDTRVIVPVAEDMNRRAMSSWATIGIRFARLKVEYHPDAPPRVKSAEDDQWVSLKPDQMDAATYLIPVDDFVSVQLPNGRVLTRAEFRKLCDNAADRAGLVARLQVQ